MRNQNFETCYLLFETQILEFSFFVSKSQSQKSHFPRPFVSRAKAPSAKRSEKGYGDQNGSDIEGQ